MKWHSMTIVLLGIGLLLGISLPTRAAEDECLEFYSSLSSDQDMRHRIDVDTGVITTFEFEYEPPLYPHPLLKSPDGRYGIERDQSSGALTLLDHETNTHLSVSESAQSFQWSPDSVWLAYTEAESRDDARPTLILYNVKTEERHQRDFDAPIGIWWAVQIIWSPDSTKIAVSMVVDIDTEYEQLLLFSVPDLTPQNVFEPMLSSVEVLWSPSGQSLIVSSRRMGEFIVIDMRDEHITRTLIGADAGYYFFWSPGEEFLVVYVTVGDHVSQLIVLDQQGEQLIDDVYVPAGQYGLVIGHEWLSNHQLVVNVWSEGLHNLTVIDLQTGMKQILYANIGDYALSSDRRTVALRPLDIRNPSTPPKEIHFFDLTRDDETLTIPIRRLTLDVSPFQFTWRADLAAVIVLFEDHSLQEYDFETETWRFIATLPDDERWSMRRVACVE